MDVFKIGAFLRSVHGRTVRVMDAPGKPIVGVRDFVTNASKIPVRIFYPSTAKGEGHVGWFVRSFAYFIDGYMHTLLPWLREYAIVKLLLTWVSFILSWILPMGNAYLPNCSYDVPPANTGSVKFPLIIFSHGLTGTGEEHALMFAYWAQRGYVVASIHHCDGSSSKVPKGDGAHLLYEHPDLTNYDKDFRPRQIEYREEELHESLQYILSDSAFPSDIRSVIDVEMIIAAGFSYGAATAALSIAKRKNIYKACFLMDGWFYIDLGEGMLFPREAHEKGLDIPALFIGSEHFANWTTCAKATNDLAKKNSHKSGSTCHIIPGSRHQNFTDIGFMLPLSLLRKANMIGSCDYDAKYDEVLAMTVAFFDLHTTTENSKKNNR